MNHIEHKSSTASGRAGLQNQGNFCQAVYLQGIPHQLNSSEQADFRSVKISVLKLRLSKIQFVTLGVIGQDVKG